MADPTISKPLSDGREPAPAEEVVSGRGGGAARTAFWLGLLGIPTFGLTAIAGIGVGVFSLRRSRPAATIAATAWCFAVLVAWLGGLVGALEVMHSVSARPVPLVAAGGRLGDALAVRIARGVDPGNPVAPDREALARLVDRLPRRYRRHAESDTLLVVEPLAPSAGVFLRWRIGEPLDPADDAVVAAVRPDRAGLYSYAVDGRQIWSFDRLTGVDWDRLDDDARPIVDATLPAARLIVAATASQDGVLPPPLEVATLLREADLDVVPTYRGRPGGLFDLFVPGTRSHATYAASGGILFPISP